MSKMTPIMGPSNFGVLREQRLVLPPVLMHLQVPKNKLKGQYSKTPGPGGSKCLGVSIGGCPTCILGGIDSAKRFYFRKYLYAITVPMYVVSL